MENRNNKTNYIITAGSAYLDIDAYACCIAMQDLLRLKGYDATAYSNALYNYSICPALVADGQMSCELPYNAELLDYIIADVSDPEYIKGSVPLERVIEVYDHHVGYESFWQERIGENSHIEFIGAAATLIYREWEKSGLQNQMSRSTALLMIAAILDNTLYLTSTNTTQEDMDVFNKLCKQASVDGQWCGWYFSEVQKSVESDLRNALMNDIKTVRTNKILPPRIAQLCIWDAESIFEQLSDIRKWLNSNDESWMVNLIDIQKRCSYFICDDIEYQKEIEKVFNVHFESGVAKTSDSYLRKEILKKVSSL